jgi:ribosomal protein S18 acetylase RimI-like enzyme
MGIALRPIRRDELPGWLARVRDGYADEMVRNGGASADQARAKAEAETESLFPGGGPSAEQFVYVVEVDGQPAGQVWFAVREGEFRRTIWVFSLDIDVGFRGRGLGRAAMLFVEDEARRRGIPKIALNVFGGNEVARGLYRSLGYDEVAVEMSKAISKG